MKKADRQKVFDKFGGRCAYTGKPLGDDWQVDHMEPQCHFRWGLAVTDKNCIDNLLPALRIINHYKRGQNLEMFRRFMTRFHERLKKLPKKTMVARSAKRKEYMLQVAMHFEITVDQPFKGIFYFETLTKEEPKP